MVLLDDFYESKILILVSLSVFDSVVDVLEGLHDVLLAHLNSVIFTLIHVALFNVYFFLLLVDRQCCRSISMQHNGIVSELDRVYGLVVGGLRCVECVKAGVVKMRLEHVQ